eukprot:CAMPEP_0168587962 /NCGR_PEP_ID=MMETSP0420-20121227/5175_1 /TAXON_ID=498008 /ORGANISM="Pessonella sp." /LENGTH=595 /DNA_ID=CAMNT_0008623311 /DNA_START=190 /DNA_END=1977 /DNA_ORIENTATION=+
MNSFQNSLPALPILSLPDTVAKFKSHAKNYLSSFEEGKRLLPETLSKADELLSSRDVQRIQSLLLNRSRKTSNWLAFWWNTEAYDKPRLPIVLHVNFYFLFANDVRNHCQTSRAASLAHAFLTARRKIELQTLEPEFKGKAPLCMSQLEHVFNTCKIPIENDADTHHNYSHEHPKHIVVVYQGKWFEIQALEDDGRVKEPSVIRMYLEHVKRSAQSSSTTSATAANVGAFTSLERNEWARQRNALCRSSVNAATLRSIESAAFAICLDDRDYGHDLTDTCRSMWLGNDATNRWFDKTLQIIVSNDGVAGVNGEHSRMDGTAAIRVIDEAFDVIASRREHVHIASEPLAQPDDNVRLLPFVDVNQTALNHAIAAHQSACDGVALRLYRHTFGKDVIKQLKVSPDAFVQLALQLAYLRTHNRFVATYESCSTRMFLHGRTEVIRPLSDAARLWCEAMQSDMNGAAALLREACAAHVIQARQCALGNGFDRHLFGLRMMARDADVPLPSLFTDQGFQAINHFQLSTSQITNENFVGYGWGPVVPDGYGVAYQVQRKALCFDISEFVESNDTDATAFIETLGGVLDEMRALLSRHSAKL